MDRTTVVELTNLCMISDGSGNVVVEEKLLKNGRGLIFPGGHIESGESIVDATIREMKEETGLTVSNLQFCGVKDWIEEDGSRYLVFLFRTECYEGELQSSEEGKIFWMPLAELKTRKDALWHLQEMLEIFGGSGYSELFFDENAGMDDVILR